MFQFNTEAPVVQEFHAEIENYRAYSTRLPDIQAEFYLRILFRKNTEFSRCVAFWSRFGERYYKSLKSNLRNSIYPI